MFDYDTPRLRIMERFGYDAAPFVEYTRRLRFGSVAPPAPFAVAGYVITTTRAGDDTVHQRMADLLNAAFRRTGHGWVMGAIATTQEGRE